MSPNRRIFLNIVATYGRSLYALVIGLFCGRWTLMLLGEVDYGLMGLVGGHAAAQLWGETCICWVRREGGGNEWIEYVSTNSTEKHGFEECKSILTNTTYNLKKTAFFELSWGGWKTWKRIFSYTNEHNDAQTPDFIGRNRDAENHGNHILNSTNSQKTAFSK